MKILKMSTIAILLSSVVLVGFSPTPEITAPASQQDPLVVFLVRHAEKTDAGKDPKLTAAGLQRASELATTLSSAAIEFVHSSDYNRTRDTSAPTAEHFGLEIQLYDPRDLPAFAEELRKTGGRHLVVGHSNTTPTLAELLGAAPAPPIDEKGEYDRIYIVTTASDGTITSVMMRYGSAGEYESE